MSTPKLKEKKPAKIAKKNETAKKHEADGAEKKKTANRSPPLSSSKLTKKPENAVKTTKIAKNEKNRSPPTSTPKLKTTKKHEKIRSDVAMEIKITEKESEHNLELPVGAPSGDPAEEKGVTIVSLPAIDETKDCTTGELKKRKKKTTKPLQSTSLPGSKNLTNPGEARKLVIGHPKTVLNVIKPACSMMESDEETNMLKKNHGFLNYEKRGKKTVFLLPGLTRPITRKAPCLDISKLKVISPISNIWKNGRMRLKFAHEEKLSVLPKGRNTKLKFPKKKSKAKKESLVKVLTKSTGHHSRFKKVITEQKSFVSKGTNMHTPMVYDKKMNKRSKVVVDDKFRNVACSNGDLRATKDATTHAEFDIERYIDDFLRKNKTVFSRRYMVITSEDETD